MNLHPIVVHFPVALLSVYCFLEVLTQFFFKENTNISFMKRALLWAGTLGVFVALATGDAAQEIYGRGPIIQLHETITDMVNVIFIVISVIYLLDIPMTPLTQKYINADILTKSSSLSKKLQAWKIVLILSLIGFAFLSALGAVGGAISRGADADPLSKFVIETFGTTYDTSETN